MMRVSLALVVGVEAGQPVARKRGLGAYVGGWNVNWSCDDGALLGLEDSWHYTWAANPSQYNKCKEQTVSAEFVPMVNGIGQAENMLGSSHYVKTWTDANAHFLLGYNEPDMGNGKPNQHPHNCTPADAAKDWVFMQRLAALFDPPLELVAPGVASSSESGGTDAWDENGHSTWLDDFLDNCANVVDECDPSLIKYIAMHDYHGSVDQLDRRLSGAVERYGRKVWLTEIAVTNWRDRPDRQTEDDYLTELLPYLDGNDNVFRYAWYSTRNQPNNQNGGSNLLEADGSPRLTSTGQIYKKNALHTLVV